MAGKGRYPGRVYAAMLSKEGVAADTYYILVDISDTTNYSHPSTTQAISLLQLDIEAESIDDGDYDVWVGVLRENDGTNGSIDWVHVFHIQTFINSSDSHGLRLTKTVDFTCDGASPFGLDCSIVSSRLVYLRSDANSGDIAALKNDVGDLGSAAGGSSLSPVAGDLMVWIEEVTGNTLDLCLTAWYVAH